MELKYFSSSSLSTSEVVHIGRTYSTLVSSFSHKVGPRYSTQFKCRRGFFLRTYGRPDYTYLADKAVTSSVGPDNFAAETSPYLVNGMNGSGLSLFSRSLRVLDAFDDEYGGVVIDPDRLSANPSVFAPMLRFSLSHWKKMEGFKYHHAEPGYVMLTYWIPEGPCMLPANASHQVGVGGFVINDNNEVLVVQEKHCSAATLGLWKIPTGFILEAEEIYTGAIREVKEETGVDTEFIEVITFRHAHNVAFEKSDLFFICMLRPLSSRIIVDEHEIEAAKWMPLVEFVKQPLIQEDSMFKKVIDIFIARLGKRYCGLAIHKMVSKFDGKPSSLYYNVTDNEDINCVEN
ncbi:PREDICTED: nudix hydrolase 8-like isoform X3 [Lupinus angustifolius]|uniref:nudix hydrolase 8-like isoform X3 n=1 Tax=Lupinus angustifolius TaxID=3871 RepID=UPI00092FC6F3|nr:PREDICTED: nudix hydrolase 8-like isoform X3 [Lupinus angustifolius]